MKSQKAGFMTLLISMTLLLCACGGVAESVPAASDSKTNTVSVTEAKNNTEASASKSDPGDKSDDNSGKSENTNVSADTGNSGSTGGNSGDGLSNTSATGSEEGEDEGYTLEYELQYYWYDAEDGRYECYPTTITRNGEYMMDNDSFPSMPFSYVMVSKGKSGVEWCNLYLSFLLEDGEIYIDTAYSKINGTFDNDKIEVYSYGEGGGPSGAFDPSPYTVSGCGTDTMTIVSEYEFGMHTHYVLKLVKDTRNMQ